MPELADAFIAHLDEDLRARAGDRAALDAKLRAVVHQGRLAWPHFELAPQLFAAHLAERMPGDGLDLAEELDHVRAADIYLACACAHDDPAAMAAFDTSYLSIVGPALSRMRVSPTMVDEVRQLVRQRLLVADGDKLPRIADYAGRGDLRNWVRATAVRTCLNQLRKHKRELLTDDDRIMAAFPADDDDPELAHMKNLYRGEFKDSFAEALGGMTDREQNLLRLYHVDDLTIDQIGAIYRVHRVTAFRWVNKAREKLVTATRRALQGRLNVSPTEVDSIMRLIRSQLDLSLARYLGSDESGQ